jgi:hypothetical protein
LQRAAAGVRNQETAMAKLGLVFVAVLVLMAAAIWGLVSVGMLPNPLAAGSRGTPVFEATNGFRFTVSTNAFGDRILLQAPVTVTYVPQPSAPDVISITPSGGTHQGTFIWTVIPSQGGARRVIGEYDLRGQVYKLCEFLDNPANRVISGAERYFLVNNIGAKYRVPERIDPAQFGILFDAAVPEQSRVRAAQLSSGDSMSISSTLARRAGDLIDICTGKRAAALR